MAPREPEAQKQGKAATQAEALLDQQRELRVIVQDLQEFLGRVRSGEVVLATYTDYVNTSVGQIARLIDGLQGDDEIQHLHDVWEQMNACPLLVNPAGNFAPNEQLSHLNTLDRLCQELVLELGMLTIPARLNDWLASTRPGYYVSFHTVFEDELPQLEDRLKVLRFLAYAPGVISNGWIDPTTGLVYRYSSQRWRQWRSVGLLLLLVAATFGLAAAAPLLGVQGWPLKPNDQGALLIDWAAVLVGVLTHLAIAAAKGFKTRGEPPALAIADLPALIDARLGQMSLKLGLALIGFAGVVFGSGIKTVTVLTAFLIGYSLDSVLELLAGSIDQRTAAEATTLRRFLQ